MKQPRLSQTDHYPTVVRLSPWKFRQRFYTIDRSKWPIANSVVVMQRIQRARVNVKENNAPKPGSASQQIRNLRESREIKTSAETFLFERFFPKLLGSSERYFRSKPSVDPVDSAQSAVRSVLADLHSGELSGVETRGELASILWHRMRAKRKDTLRRINAQKRPPSDRQVDINDVEIHARVQTEDRIAARQLSVDFLCTLPANEQLTVAYRALEYENKEIAALLNVSERTVVNYVSNVQKKSLEYLKSNPKTQTRPV